MKSHHLWVLNLITAMVLGAAAPAQASTVGIISASSLGTTDSFDWTQLGLNSGTITGSQNVVSSGGIQGTISSAGNSFQVLQESTSWQGNFTPNMVVLWDNGVGPDITFTIANPAKGFGAEIDPDFNGNFTAQITAYGSGGNALGSFTENGVANANDDGSAIFIGIADANADIAKVQFVLTDAASSPNDFAIGTLDVSGVSETPLPASLPMFLSALAVFGFYSRKKKAVA